jgi:hypothetical protein
LLSTCTFSHSSLWLLVWNWQWPKAPVGNNHNHHHSNKPHRRSQQPFQATPAPAQYSQSSRQHAPFGHGVTPEDQENYYQFDRNSDPLNSDFAFDDIGGFGQADSFSHTGTTPPPPPLAKPSSPFHNHLIYGGQPPPQQVRQHHAGIKEPRHLQRAQNNCQTGNNPTSNMATGKRKPAPKKSSTKPQRQSSRLQKTQVDEDDGRLGNENGQRQHDDEATVIQEENQESDSSDNSGDEEEENLQVVGTDCIPFQGRTWVIPEETEKRRKNIVLAVNMLDTVKTKYREAKDANKHNVAALRRVNHENEQLKKEIATLQAQVSKFGKNDAVVAQLDTLVKKKLFPFVKFICSEEKQLEAAVSVYKWILQEEHGKKITDEDIDEVHMAGWVKTYGSECTSSLNRARGDCSQRMLSEYKNLMKENQEMFGNNKGPTVEELMRCALREIDMQNEREVMIMEWYITNLFCKLVQNFGQGAHNFATLLLTHTFLLFILQPGPLVISSGRNRSGSRTFHLPHSTLITTSPRVGP